MNNTIQQKRSELLGLVQEEIAEKRKAIERLEDIQQETQDELDDLTELAHALIED